MIFLVQGMEVKLAGEYYFQITVGIQEDNGLCWKMGKDIYLLELEDASTLNSFFTIIGKCIFESTNNSSSDNISNQQLIELITPHSINSNNNNTTSNSNVRTTTTPIKSTSTTPVNNNKQEKEKEEKIEEGINELINNMNTLTIDGNEVFESDGILYLFNSNSKQFECVTTNTNNNIIKIKISKLGDNKTIFNSKLYIVKTTNKEKEEVIYSQDITNEMFMHFNDESKSIIWSSSNEKGIVYSWSVVFLDIVNLNKFKEQFAIGLWEHNAKQPFSKVKKEDANWILDTYSNNPANNSNIMETDDGSTDYDKLDFVTSTTKKNKEERREKEEEEDDDDEEEEEEEDEEEEEEEEEELEINKNAKNSLLAVGYNSDRSYVVRGTQIGVFKNNENKLKYSTSIKNVKTKGGELFSPKKMMLHQQDNSLLLMKPDENKKIYKMDLNRTDVIEEWKMHENYAVKEILGKTKYSQATNENSLMGINELGIMYIDPRLPNQKVVDSQSFFYKPTTKPMFSCAATTGSGDMVIGSKNGDIRLYNEKSIHQNKKELEQAPRAKTSLPGFGDPIIGIDTTEDGNWILATCKSYLLVIPTQTTEGGSGFNKSMGKEKPVPRRLQLKTEHIAQMGGVINFTPAKFNTGQSQERSIVTSTGPYVITWNFRKVKQNKLNEYQIKKYNDTIVADQFRFRDDQSIVVTLPNDVSLAKKSIKN